MSRLVPLVLALLLAVPATGGDLYRWVDDRGEVHFTDDPTRIPERHRGEATPGDFPTPRVPTPSPEPLPAAPLPEPATEERAPAHLIRVEKAGLEIVVLGTLNGRVEVPFKVDTGAMINTIPSAAAERLGVSVAEPDRRMFVVGIGGQPQLVPVVRLRRIDVGGAVVEDLEAAVLDTLEVGLLGMPFFRHFRVDLDPLAGLMRLEEVDISGIEGLYGGYPESYWRATFRMVHTQLRTIEDYRERIPEEFADLHRQLDEAEHYWRSESDRIDIEASRAGVPRAWRQ